MVTELAVSIPSQVPTLSVDVVIAAGTLLVIGYSMIAGHASLVREAISIYVGLVLASSFGEPLYNQLSGSGQSFSVTQTEVQLVLLLVPIGLLQFGRHHAKHAKKHNMIITVLLAFATAMLLISSVLAQLDAVALAHATDTSNLASWIYEFRLLWLGLVPVGIAASALIHPKARHH